MVDPEAIDTASVLELIASQSVYGRITILNKYRPADSLVDHLFLGTDQAFFFTARWDPQSRRLLTGSRYHDLADKTARVSQTGERSSIDPSQQFLLLEVYEGILTTIPLIGGTGKQPKRGIIGSPLPARISEFHVKSSAFIQRPRKIPRLVLLVEDYEGNSRLKFRDLEYSPNESAEWLDLDDDHSEREDLQLDLGASHLIPVQEEPYGLIILTETSILYYDDTEDQPENHVTQVLPKPTIWLSWTRIDNQRYVIADEYAKVYLLMLQLDARNNVSTIMIDEQVSPAISQAACLQYLDNGLVFIGSHQGDSQIIRLQQVHPKIVQVLPSLAPILDFTVMDMGNRSGAGPANEYSTGQARIVTGSGSWSDGTVRSVRSGVGIELLALLPDFAHVTNLFPVRIQGASQANALLVSFADETRMLAFSPNARVSELDSYKDIIFTDQTLVAQNICDDQLVQVTRTTVIILNLQHEVSSQSWRTACQEQITCASSNDDNLAVCINGQRIIIIDLKGRDLNHAKHLSPCAREISCIALSSLLQNICLVGYWDQSDASGSTIDILDLVDGKTLGSIKTDEEDDIVPRSILLSNANTDEADGDLSLFVAMADGHVVSSKLNRETFKVRQTKRTILGTREAELKELTRGDLSSVFVASEHPSLIYSDQGRMTFSAVDAEQINSVCSFDSEAFPGAVIFATASHDLRIGRIGDQPTTHVQPLQMGETARRLAYSRKLKAFGIGTIERRVEDGAEVCYSSLQLVDEVVFKKLDVFKFARDVLVESVIRAELDDGYGNLVERFIIGTGLVDTCDEEFHGQILVLEVTEERKLRVIAKERTKGSCRTLGVIGQGRIIAGLNKTVAVYAYVFSSTGTPSFRKVATRQVSTMPIAMCITGDQIAVADLMKSITILQYKAKDPSTHSGESITELARHYQTFWSTAVTKVDDHSWLGSDAEGNLLVLSRNLDGPTLEDQRRLVVDCEFNLGELVNQMRSLDVEASPDALIIPKAFLATERLAERVVALGDIPFMKYRAIRNEVNQEDEPRRFVDGELIEQFLDCDAAVQHECLQGLSIAGQAVTVEQVKDIVDALRRMH